MALSRVKVWIPGDILTASDLNSEFNNIINNPISLISPSTGAINFALQAHTGIIPAAVSATSASGGQVLMASTAATPLAAWSNPAAAAGSRVMGLNGTLSSQSGTFTANQYLLQTTAGTNSFVVNSTASFTVSIGTAGPAANGRDVAGAFASTYIHWYAITTGVGSTSIAGLVSSQAPPTGPVMPTNYSAWAYLGGSVYTSASTTVAAAHRLNGSWVTYEAATAVLSAGAATTEATVSVSTAIPTNALNFTLSGQWGANGNSAGDMSITNEIRIASSVTHRSNQAYLQGLGAAHNYGASLSDITLPNISQQFYYIWTSVGAGASAQSLSLSLARYQVPNGGV